MKLMQHILYDTLFLLIYVKSMNHLIMSYL